MPWLLDSPRRLAGLAVLAGAAALLAALIAQYGFGLAPCPLCLDQRYAHLAAIALAAPALALAAPAGRWLVAAAGLAFLAGAAVAGFHLGVEQQWWAGGSGCTAPAIDPGASAAELRRQLLDAPLVRCDEVAWSLFGVSMAGYNFLYSLALGTLMLAGAARRARE